MKCVICKHGETMEGITSVTLQRNDTVIVVKNVPAEICDNCSEYYLSDKVLNRIQPMADDAVNKGIEVQVVKYVA